MLFVDRKYSLWQTFGGICLRYHKGFLRKWAWEYNITMVCTTAQVLEKTFPLKFIPHFIISYFFFHFFVPNFFSAYLICCVISVFSILFYWFINWCSVSLVTSLYLTCIYYLIRHCFSWSSLCFGGWSCSR